MEPVFMMLGHAAGAAASLAVDKGVTVQQVPYPALKERLLAEKQILDRKTSPPDANASKEKPADSTPPDVQLAADLKVLIEKKVVDTADYWLAHARKGASCDGDKVAELFMKMSAAFKEAGLKNVGSVSDVNGAIAMLTEKRLFNSREYWTSRAVPGGKCSGDLVAGIIRRFVAKLEAK
jgi:hypothetical protein